MSSLDDIIGECEKQAAAERLSLSLTPIAPDPICLVVKVHVPDLHQLQASSILSLVETRFMIAGVTPPPIIVIDDRLDITAIPKSMLVE